MFPRVKKSSSRSRDIISAWFISVFVRTEEIMSITRRTFFGQVAAGVLISAGTARAAEHRIDRLGVQLYTVRDLMAKDFEGTLAKVAARGYAEVGFAGYFDPAPKAVKAIL